jgi:hypothetical protein
LAAKVNIRSAESGNEPGGSHEYASIMADLELDNLAFSIEVPSLSNLPPYERSGKIFSSKEVIRLRASGTDKSRVGQYFRKETTDESIPSTTSRSCEGDCFETPGRTFMDDVCHWLKIVVT